MTIDIAHLRELLAKATPGPWVVCWWSRTIKQLRNMQRHLWEKPFNIAKIPCRQGKYPISHEEYEANIELMVALVNAAPELLDRLADTENCICWGVDCPHQAKALDMVYAREREVDELKAKLAAAEERAATKQSETPDPTRTAIENHWRYVTGFQSPRFDDLLDAFEAAVRADEREACAAIGDRLVKESDFTSRQYFLGYRAGCERTAELIRARGGR